MVNMYVTIYHSISNDSQIYLVIVLNFRTYPDWAAQIKSVQQYRIRISRKTVTLLYHTKQAYKIELILLFLQYLHSYH